MSRWETVLNVLTLKSAVKDESKGHFSPIIEMFDLGIRVKQRWCKQEKRKRPLALWRHFTATTRILRFSLSCTNYGWSPWDYQIKKKTSIKVTPSCKCVVFVDKSALKNIFSRVQRVLRVVHVLSSTTTPPPLKCGLHLIPSAKLTLTH